MGEKWQNLPFLGRTHTLVPIPKVGTSTHCVEGIWYRYEKFGHQYPFTSKGLVPVPVPELPTTLFLHTLHCYVSYSYTDCLGTLIKV